MQQTVNVCRIPDFFLNALWDQFNIFHPFPPPSPTCWKTAGKYQEMVLSCSYVFICPVPELLNCSLAPLPQPCGAFGIPGAGRWLGFALCQASGTPSQIQLCRLPSEKKFKKKCAKSSSSELGTVYTSCSIQVSNKLSPWKAVSPLLNMSSKHPFS